MFQYQPSEKITNCFNCKFCNNVQIPSLPLLGPKSFDQILCFILEAIEGEANAADFYRHLLKEAPNKLHCQFIQQAYIMTNYNILRYLQNYIVIIRINFRSIMLRLRSVFHVIKKGC